MVLSAISPNLFIGDEACARDKEELKKLNITHIVNASLEDEVPNCFAGEGWIEYLRIDVADKPATNLRIHFDEVNRFISRALSVNFPGSEAKGTYGAIHPMVTFRSDV